MITLWIKVNQVSLKTLWMGNDGGNIINSHPAAERDEVRGEDTLGGAAV